jgi:hypothetical protein
MPGASHRRRSGVALAAVAGVVALVVLGGPAAAHAEPIFTEGGCVVSRLSDGGAEGAQCAGLDLSGTRFGEGDFRGADLTGASFAGGDVQGASFVGATLTGADFTGTRIVGADFSGSGILPAQIDLEADATGTAPVEFAPALPAGLALEGCSIVGEPVAPGQTFPIGSSNVLCTLTTSFAGTASAVMAVNVTASATAAPTRAPLFTPVPVTQGPGSTQEVNGLMVAGFIGGGVLVLGGIAAFVVANRKPGPRASRRGPESS